MEEARRIVEEDDFSEEAQGRRRVEDERWRQEKALLRRAAAERVHRRAEAEAALADLARIGGDDSFQLITKLLDDPSADVRNAAVRALYELNPNLAVSFFNGALREGSAERRRKIGAALADSGLARDAINDLMNENHESTYSAFSLLFLMAKAGEVRPLLRVIRNHPSIDLRLALVKLLALSGEPEIVPAFRRLALRGSLPPELRSAVMEAICHIGSKARLSRSFEG